MADFLLRNESQYASSSDRAFVSNNSKKRSKRLRVLNQGSHDEVAYLTGKAPNALNLAPGATAAPKLVGTAYIGNMNSKGLTIVGSPHIRDYHDGEKTFEMRLQEGLHVRDQTFYDIVFQTPAIPRIQRTISIPSIRGDTVFTHDLKVNGTVTIQDLVVLGTTNGVEGGGATIESGLFDSDIIQLRSSESAEALGGYVATGSWAVTGYLLHINISINWDDYGDLGAGDLELLIFSQEKAAPYEDIPLSVKNQVTDGSEIPVVVHHGITQGEVGETYYAEWIGNYLQLWVNRGITGDSIRLVRDNLSVSGGRLEIQGTLTLTPS